MTTVQIVVKHAGKQYPAAIDVSKSASDFQTQVATLTEVPVERQKILIKGGTMKPDTRLADLNIKEGQVFTVIGAKSSVNLPPAPSAGATSGDGDGAMVIDEPPKKLPAGLRNVGNTCYMNSALQLLRSMPEFRKTLSSFKGAIASSQSAETLVSSFRDLLNTLSSADEAPAPLVFWNLLKISVPEFAAQRNGHYAQQDAQECLSHLITSCRSQGALFDELSTFIHKYVTLKFVSEMKADEAKDETPEIRYEELPSIQCHITSQTNFLVTAMSEALEETILKRSPTLERDIEYRTKKRLSRIPTYFIVHLLRFDWRTDIRKKVKIQRKVKFPLELDVLEFLESGLKEKVGPINSLMKKAIKERGDRAQIRSRLQGQKRNDLDDEHRSAYEAEKKEMEDLATKQGLTDYGTNASGMYELVSLITHKGNDAEAGHYINWTRSDMVLGPDARSFGAPPTEWFKFDDNTVSSVSDQKIASLDGGGEDSSAYILLYRSMDL